MVSPVGHWIKDNVRGLTFCDIGGIGLNCLNERVTIAAKAGAANATMIDYRRFGFPEWDVFAQKVKDADVTGVRMIDGANLESADFSVRVGQHDFVHCTGIFYHAPSPLRMLENLSRVTRRYLIVNTVVVPDVIETEVGRLTFTPGSVVFLPSLSDRQRAIFERYYQSLLDWPEGRFTLFAPRIDDDTCPLPWLQTRARSEEHFWGERGELSYSPYWWLFTEQAFRAAVRLFAFNILGEHWFKRHALTLFCERNSEAGRQTKEEYDSVRKPPVPV